MNGAVSKGWIEIESGSSVHGMDFIFLHNLHLQAFSLSPISSLSAVCLNVFVVFRLSGVFPLWISYITRNLVD